MEPVSTEAHHWISGWLSGGAEAGPPSERVREELVEYAGAQDLTLYRVTKDEAELSADQSQFSSDRYSSWTHRRSVAALFEEGLPAISAVIGADDIFVDTVLMDRDFIYYRCSGFPEKAEVIAKP